MDKGKDMLSKLISEWGKQADTAPNDSRRGERATLPDILKPYNTGLTPSVYQEWRERLEICLNERANAEEWLIYTGAHPDSDSDYQNLNALYKTIRETPESNEASQSKFDEFTQCKETIEAECTTKRKAEDTKHKVYTYQRKVREYQNNRRDVREVESVNSQYRSLCESLNALESSAHGTPESEAFAADCERYIDSIDSAINKRRRDRSILA